MRPRHILAALLSSSIAIAIAGCRVFVPGGPPDEGPVAVEAPSRGPWQPVSVASVALMRPAYNIGSADRLLLRSDYSRSAMLKESLEAVLGDAAMPPGPEGEVSEESWRLRVVVASWPRGTAKILCFLLLPCSMLYETFELNVIATPPRLLQTSRPEFLPDYMSGARDDVTRYQGLLVGHVPIETYMVWKDFVEYPGGSRHYSYRSSIRMKQWFVFPISVVHADAQQTFDAAYRRMLEPMLDTLVEHLARDGILVRAPSGKD